MDKVVTLDNIDNENRLEVVNEIERLDDEQILKMLVGLQIHEFFYSIPFKTKIEQGGKVDCGDPKCEYNRRGISHVHVIDISAAGVFEVLRLMGNIDITTTEPRLHVDEDTGERYWICGARVTDKHTGYSVILWYREPDNDKYAFDKVQSKAIRNAGRKIIPQGIKSRLIQLAVSGKLTPTEQDILSVIQGNRSLPKATPRQTVDSIKNEVPSTHNTPLASPSLSSASGAPQSPPPGDPFPGDTITERQRRYLWVKAREAGLSNEELHDVIKEFGYEHTRDIYKSDMDAILSAISTYKDRKDKDSGNINNVDVKGIIQQYEPNDVKVEQLLTKFYSEYAGQVFTEDDVYAFLSKHGYTDEEPPF